MKKVFITYAEGSFIKNQLFALKMAMKRGKFDSAVGYSREDIDSQFYLDNYSILKATKGAGYWLWKPYFIYKALNELNDGDILFYADAGSFFRNDINIIIDELSVYNQDVIAFYLPLIEIQWTKQELIKNMECNKSYYKYSNQLNGSFHLIVKSKFSLNFYREYLKLSCNRSNISDDFEEGVTQHHSFINHRHDQSIFSLLYKKYKLRGFKDPTQFGKYPEGYSECVDTKMSTDVMHTSASGRHFIYRNYNEKYKEVIFHTRQGHPITRFLKYKVKEIFRMLNIYKGVVN